MPPYIYACLKGLKLRRFKAMVGYNMAMATGVRTPYTATLTGVHRVAQKLSHYHDHH